MKTLFSLSRRKLTSEGFAPAAKSMRLTRTFIETGDERCPLAGIWLPIADCDVATDDPELARPAMWRLLAWRAFTVRSQSFDRLLSHYCYL